jgi:cytochrome b
MVRVRIWDLPTRLFHWGLVVCVTGLVITGNLGGNAMLWHFRFGYCVLSLLLFRVIWGVVGGFWSRWSQLPISPSRVLDYLKGRDRFTQFAGHNPLGSLSVVAFLLILFLQSGTGLISDDEIANMGPLSSLASSQWVSLATSWHKGWGKTTLFILVCIHVLAIIWYRWRKSQALIPAMWHGDKSMPVPVDPSADHGRSRAWAVVLFLASALVVFGIISMGG